jgi:hypothetical protein
MTTLAAPEAPFRLTTPIEHITKLDDGTLLVHCTVTSEAPDSQGEIVDYDAFKMAAPGLMKWAVLSQMHDPMHENTGTILQLHFDDAARRVEADVHVVDAEAVKKVLARVYKMVSIGGIKLATTVVQEAGRTFRKITRLIVDELSLVPRGANPEAMISKQFVLAKKAQEIDMTDAMDAGSASPLGEPTAAVAEARTPEQAAIDETRAALSKADPPAEEDPKLPFPGAKPPIKAKKTKKAKVAKVAKPAPSPEVLEEKRLRKEATKLRKLRKARAVLAHETKLAKKNKTLSATADALESVGEAMAEEAKEQAAGSDESSDLDNLATADAALHAVQANESAEPGEDMGKKYRAVRKQATRLRKFRKAATEVAREQRRIAKVGARNSKGDGAQHEAIHGALVKLGYTKCMTKAPEDGTEAETVTAIAKTDTDPNTIMRAALASVLPADKLDAIEAALTKLDEKSSAQGEQLAKIAKSPSGGGPATPYAAVFRGAADAEVTDKASALAKAASVIDDPRLKEQVSEAAAFESIRAARGGG